MKKVLNNIGIVFLASWYHLNYKSSDRKALNVKQTALLRRLREQLAGEDRDTINSILFQFAP